MFSISIDGEYIENENLIDAETVDVQINMDQLDETLCAHCSEPISNCPPCGWMHDENDARLCNGIDHDDIRSDLKLEDDAEVTEEMILGFTIYTLAEPAPKKITDYVNWIGAQVRENSVEVQISVGEERGCFTMSFWVGEDGQGYLSMPYPGESTPHVPTERLTDGTLILKP